MEMGWKQRARASEGKRVKTAVCVSDSDSNNYLREEAAPKLKTVYKRLRELVNEPGGGMHTTSYKEINTSE